MRVKSSSKNSYTIYAISGTNTVSFAIDFRQADTKGLLGYSVERIDVSNGERKYMDGFKVFKDDKPHASVDTVVSTYSHPVQSFVWDDFTCRDNTTYEYLFYPVKGKPGNLKRESPIKLSITTEKLFSNQEHDIFFNRGVASSQAYRRKFFNLRPDEITNPSMRQKAFDWLSRSLDEAILKFINNAEKGDSLLGCFYEFHYEPVVKAFAAAIKRGVHVKLIIDAKKNKPKDKNGNILKSFPREENLKTLKNAGIDYSPKGGIVFKREANTSNIQHNKFIVFIDKSKGNKATEVWTGSMNVSLGGVHGQTNVGHWIKNSQVAIEYQRYWDILSKDPGAKDSFDTAKKKKANADLKKQIEELQPNIAFESWDDIPVGVTPIFSPRSGDKILTTYARMLDSAEDLSCITLAFGINKVFKDFMIDNNSNGHISFLLLEKEDKQSPKSKTPFVFIGAKQNVYKSWGAYLEDNLQNWAREVSTRHLKLNKHVAYIHSKFMLVDPLSTDPVVVTGSANFSKASTNNNDENMVIIRGDQRVADIYFTEFNRLFHHFYFRAVYKKAKEQKRTDNESLWLTPNDSWQKKYKKGTFRYKRVNMFSKMQGL